MRLELSVNELLYTIDKKMKVPETTVAQLKRNEQYALAMIINRVDDDHHSLITDCTSPEEAMKVLDTPELSHISVLTRR